MRAVFPRCAGAWIYVLAVALSSGAASGQSSTDQLKRLEELERKLKQLDPNFQPGSSYDERMRALEAKLDELLAARQAPKPADPVVAAPPPTPTEVLAPVQTVQAPTASLPLQQVTVSGDFEASGESETRLPVSGYMDFHINKERGDAWRPDFHRFVLLFGHSFSDRIKFWSELEVEHSFVAGGEPSGEVALEQAYLDFFYKPWLNVRTGMLLTPVGIVNERHEPPSFNGVERPFVETFIIPTTWRELGFGLTGDLGRGFRYRAYLTSALNARFFDAENGIGEGRTRGFESSMQNPAQVARLEYAGVRRLTLGASAYTGIAGFDTPGVNPRVTLASFDGRYSVGQIDLRGLFVDTWVSNTAALNNLLELQNGLNPNVARRMRGYYFEPAYHLLPRRFRHDLLAFARFERYNTQHRMADGFEPLNEFNRSSWVTGLTYRPHPDVVVKFDYVFNRNQSEIIRAIDGINFGVGWWF